MAGLRVWFPLRPPMLEKSCRFHLTMTSCSPQTLFRAIVPVSLHFGLQSVNKLTETHYSLWAKDCLARCGTLNISVVNIVPRFITVLVCTITLAYYYLKHFVSLVKQWKTHLRLFFCCICRWEKAPYISLLSLCSFEVPCFYVYKVTYVRK